MGAQTWVTISVCPQWHLFVVTKSFRFQSGLEWAQSTNRTPVRAQCKGVTCERAGNHCVKRDGNPSCFRRGIVNRTLGNRTEFDWVGHSNQIERGSLCEFQSYSIEQIELNRTQSMLQIVLDWVRQPNFISNIIQWIAFDCVGWINSLKQTFFVMRSVWSRKHEKHESWYTRIKRKKINSCVNLIWLDCRTQSNSIHGLGSS